jgi:hypothetical protein
MTGSPTGRRRGRPPGPFSGGNTGIAENRKLHSNLEPGPRGPTPAERPLPLAEAQDQAEDRARDRQQRRWNRTRSVRIVCTVVNVVCGLFAVVLVAQIVMVMGEANPANEVASFVRGFSAVVSLGFDNLFTPANVKFQVLLNDGFAAIVWLALGAVVTTLIRRFALPSSGGLVR